MERHNNISKLFGTKSMWVDSQHVIFKAYCKAAVIKNVWF